jgi:hypothetical protein
MECPDIVDERFRIEHLAGRGGMGEVYRAVDERTGETVALKRLHRGADAEVARFEREVRLLASFDDPRVVRYIAHGVTADIGPYLVMEWLDGEDLAARLAHGRLGAAEAVAMAGEIALALAALHDRGVVHRDLKPSNVFLVDGRLDRIKVLDFGIAVGDASTRMTLTGALVGTAGYMAPEQVRSAQPVDARADVFALGCILLECLSGEPAFQGSQVLALITKILLDDPPRLADRCPGAPAALAALLDSMLVRIPSGRPKDGRAVADALRLVTGLPAAPFEHVPTGVAAGHLTDSEQRGLAVILVGPGLGRRAGAGPIEANAWLEAHALAHGASFERLLDGSVAMVLWSAQVATDLAARAATCALEIITRAPERPVGMAMGRSAVTGRLPVGAVIDRAARLMLAPAPSRIDAGATDAELASSVRLAPESAVAVDEVAAGLLDSRFELQRHEERVWLVGERDVTRARQVLGRDTPCVGRDRELRALEALFQDCVGDDGGAQVALVTGPPGIGKSRLAHELLARLAPAERSSTRADRLVVWSARADLNRAGSAFSVVAGLVRSAAGLRAGDGAAAARSRLQAAIGHGVPDADRVRLTEFLSELVGAPPGDAASLPLRAARRDPSLMNVQLRSAFRDLVAGVCARAPLLLVLEDLHWADVPSIEAIGEVLVELEEAPLFVLALARPELHETHPALWSSGLVQEFRIRELPSKASERLIRHLLGDAADPALVTRLVTLSEGNAFYLEELIRASAEGAADDLPETVVAMVQSRLGALADDERRALRAAAVFGETCWASGVSALLGGVTVTSTLDRLVERELLLPRSDTRLAGQREFAFRHALLREGAYVMLTEEDRALGHRLAGAWLERHGEADPFVLAQHFERGNEPERAAVSYLLAAERAGLAGDTLGAIARIRSGLACALSGPARRALLGLSCQVHYNRVDMLEQALEHSAELLGSADAGSGPWAQAMLVDLTAAVKAGRMDDFQRSVGVVLSTAFTTEALDPASLTLATICYLLELGGAFSGANLAFDQFERLVTKAGDDIPNVTTLHRLYDSLRSGHVYKDPQRGLVRSLQARELARAIGHQKYATMASLFEALNRWYLGDHLGARDVALTLDTSADESGFASATRPFMMAWLLADLREFDAARTWADRLVAAGRTRHLMLDEARGQWVLGEVLRRAGAHAAARAAIDAAVTLLRVMCPLDVPGALATSAALHLDTGAIAEALADAREAGDRAATIGACSQFYRDAFLRRVQVDVLRAAGHHDEADVVQSDAVAALEATAARIGDVTARARFLDATEDHRRLRGR